MTSRDATDGDNANAGKPHRSRFTFNAMSGATAEGVRAYTKNIPPDVSAYCLTRSHSTNPLKGSSTALALPAPAPLANTVSARLSATVTALRARESKFRHLGENAPDAVTARCIQPSILRRTSCSISITAKYWTLLTKVETSCDRILIAGGANVEAEWEQGPAV